MQHVLKLPRTIFMVSGCFRPQSWTSLFKRTIYNIYKLYIITMLYTFTILQIMDIVLYVDNTDDFTSNLNVMINALVACYKMFVMSVNYENIIALIKCLTEEPFKPLDSEEIKIRRQFDRIIRNNTLLYTVSVVISVTFVILSSLFTDFRYKKLKFREWIPYDYSSTTMYCFTYFQQMLGACHSVVVTIATDNLMCGFLMHICCQIEILEYRLKKILNNRLTLGYCIRHHNQIFEFAQIINLKFTKIIGFQFLASTMVMCCNLYQVTKSSLNANNLWLIMFTNCILTQIFIYCWFGNKVKLKSLQLIDSIFQMNWPILDNSVKKSLVIIMKRAMIPIEISTIFILTLNLDSFVALLKTSYSIYNLLVRVQE
ncbi:odorant receptor 46a isoform X2 [Monomorium pharaonis]|uniref:odorant receptor 46a isoform X2 n=1 Tax=Monomorium pharaonis TaxID=307658 RepID=UPI00063EF4DB|nr:odorant receptor 46a isoform X2 [Monomorium pharaonis]